MGLFITFEGGEGCGKSTQARALWRKLTRLGIPSELTHEPGGTVLGSEIRHSLKRRRHDKVPPETELFLFAACRYQLVTQVISPCLEKGMVVICDRFADSTTVYQGYGRGIDMTIIKAVNEMAMQGIKPVLTILLDIAAEKGLTRRRVEIRDRFEEEELAFHDRIRNGYLQMVAEEPDRWLVIDATLPKAEIGKIIWNKVSHLISQRQNTLKHG